ncbi:hypothetical protein ACXIUS_29675 [Bosea thiooxidans]
MDNAKDTRIADLEATLLRVLQQFDQAVVVASGEILDDATVAYREAEEIIHAIALALRAWDESFEPTRTLA